MKNLLDSILCFMFVPLFVGKNTNTKQLHSIENPYPTYFSQFFVQLMGRTTVTNLLGRQIHNSTMSGQNYSLERGSLSGGLNFYEIHTEGGAVIGHGKICFD